MPEMSIWEQLKSESLSTEQGSQREVIEFLIPIHNVPSYRLFLIYILRSSWLQHCNYKTKILKCFKIQELCLYFKSSSTLAK